MPMIKKKPPVFEGDGQVRFLGHEAPARYAIEGDPARLRQGPLRLRGGLTLTPELAASAFRAGEGVLTLDTGLQLRVVMVGHSEGGAEVFVELRV
ncbi:MULTISPECIES: hypothetical protein [unclassified Phenylobacterium]|uniref:hypothetical protein n=1 Tax=unclassified Phenylobacterium TaxID=2640670 RepID=UPI00083B73A2|nr:MULTISPECIES: hypothetical protein [unclassified Phenylobacterium]